MAQPQPLAPPCRFRILAGFKVWCCAGSENVALCYPIALARLPREDGKAYSTVSGWSRCGLPATARLRQAASASRSPTEDCDGMAARSSVSKLLLPAPTVIASQRLGRTRPEDGRRMPVCVVGLAAWHGSQAFGHLPGPQA